MYIYQKQFIPKSLNIKLFERKYLIISFDIFQFSNIFFTNINISACTIELENMRYIQRIFNQGYKYKNQVSLLYLSELIPGKSSTSAILYP